MNVSAAALATIPAEARRTGNRERAMTDSSTGSFATYFSDHERILESPYAEMMVDRSEADAPEALTPDQLAPLEEQVQQAQWQATDALDALRHLSEGIRIITRQMKHSHDDFQEPSSEDSQEGNLECHRDRSWSGTCSMQSNASSDDERRLSDLSLQLEGTLGADLMGLSHAAQMLGENSRMVSHEASLLVRDVHAAQETCQEAMNRANKAESVVKILYKKQKSFIGQVEKAKNERNVLKRQVKALMEENAALKKQNEVVRALELHVAGALHAHERQLALQQTKRQAENTEEASANVATVRLKCPSFDETTDLESDCNEEHFAAATTTETSELKAPSTISDGEPFVEVVKDNDTKPAEESVVPHKAAMEKEKRGPGIVGFGGAIGFGGGFVMKRPSSWRPSKPKPKHKPVAGLEKTVDTTSTDDQVVGPALITPTNSGDEPDASALESCSEGPITFDLQDAISSHHETRHVPEKLTTTESNHQPAPVTPSPTEISGLMKSFFHLGSKDYVNKDRASKVIVRKPLLRLHEDESCDPTESSNDCHSTSEITPRSEPSSDQNSFPLEYSADRLPPKSLACHMSGHVSPYSDEVLHVPSNGFLDDRVFRSLAIPAMIMSSPRVETPKSMPELPQCCPPEISQIYAEMASLHEC